MTCLICKKQAEFVAAGRALFHLLDNGDGEAWTFRGNSHQSHQRVSCIVGGQPPVSIIVIYVRSARFLFILVCWDKDTQARPTKQSCS